MRIYLTAHGGGTREITSLVVSAVWSGDKATITRKLAVTMLHDEEEDWPVPQEGDGMTLEGESGTRFRGYVVKTHANSERGTMDVTCFDGGIYLRNNDGTYKFRLTPPEDIAAAVCGDYGVPVKALASTGALLDRKFSATKLDKIVRTAYTLAAEQTGERYAIRMTPEGLEVKVQSQTSGSIRLRPRSNLMSADTTESIVGMVNSVGIYDQQGQRVTTVADSAAKVLYGTMERHLRQTESNDPYAEAEALLADNGFSQNVQVEVLGDARLVTGETVMVREEHTGLAGLFWIDADTHTWKRDQYTCKLTLNCRNVMTRTNAGSEEL